MRVHLNQFVELHLQLGSMTVDKRLAHEIDISTREKRNEEKHKEHVDILWTINDNYKKNELYMIFICRRTTRKHVHL